MQKSDRRIKQNIVDLTGCIAKIQATRPRNFQFIDDPTITVPGFIAQEFITPFPDNVLVNGDNGIVPLGSNYPWQIDDEVLKPWLTGAIIELKTLIDAIPSTVNFGQRVLATLSDVTAAASGTAKTIGTLTIPSAGKWQVYLKAAVTPNGLTLTMTQTTISISTVTNTDNTKNMVRDYYALVGGNVRHISPNPFWIQTAGSQDIYAVLNTTYTGTAPNTVAANSEFYAVQVGL